MIYIVNKTNRQIVALSESVTYWENGYPVANNTAYADAIAIEGMENIEDFEPAKYCYEESKGVYNNPAYIEPVMFENAYGIPDEIYQTIIDDYTIELIEEGVIG